MALEHPDEAVRAGAAAALGRLAVPAALEPLSLALHDPVRSVQEQAAFAMGKFGTAGASSLLAEIQEADSDSLLGILQNGLRKVHSQNAVDILCAALTYPEAAARLGAADALGEIGDPEAVPFLIKATQFDDIATQQHAGAALAKIGAPQALQVLTAFLSHEDARMRQHAVEKLGELGGEPVALPLLTALEDRDESVRLAAAEALRAVQDSAATEILLTACIAGQPWVRRTLSETLGYNGDPIVIDALHDLATEDGDLQTRLNAAQSLVLLGDKRGEKMILRTLNAPNSDTRRIAAIALGNTGDKRALVHLLQGTAGLQTDTPQGKWLRGRMVQALVRIGVQAVPDLVRVLGSNDAARRQLAYDALEEIGSPALSGLVETFKNFTLSRIRVSLANLLGSIRDRRAAGLLEDVLRDKTRGWVWVNFYSSVISDPGKPVRIAAVKALAKIGMPASAFPLFETARFDPDAEVRQGARRALAQVGAPEIVMRMAELDMMGTVVRGSMSVTAVVILGLLVGSGTAAWGITDAALLGGLVCGAIFGVSDGFTGGVKSVRWTLAGGIGALGLTWLFSGMLQAASARWLWTVLLSLGPVLGAALNWQKATITHRFIGVFGGMVIGFLFSAISALLLGTIGTP